jgi:acetyl esterase/lipase
MKNLLPVFTVLMILPMFFSNCIKSIDKNSNFGKSCDSSPCLSNQASKISSPQSVAVVRNILYQTPQTWSDKLARLDIHYHSDTSSLKPTVVFVHGGGWIGGDKSNVESRNPDMIKFFNDQGYIFVAINFRLYKSSGSPDSGYKEQVTDVARALKWLSTNLKTYGGKADDFTLFGFSSGAHLVALAGTDEGYLKAEGLDFAILKAIISMDVPQYNVPLSLQLLKDNSLEERKSFIEGLFGNTEVEQLNGSPSHFAATANIKPFLLVTSGIINGKDQDISNQAAEAFKDLLVANNHSAEHTHFADKKHNDLVLHFGKEADGATEVVNEFLSAIRR